MFYIYHKPISQRQNTEHLIYNNQPQLLLTCLIFSTSASRASILD